MSGGATRRELDSIRIPLDGVHLVEAAAGTGKTHNIQNLAARMVVEKAIPIDAVVLVTFTEAAAAELGERFRAVLTGLEEALRGRWPEEEVRKERFAGLLEHFAQCGVPVDVQKDRVRDALRNFDAARVSTLHGFCARVLSENAFESGVVFQSALEKNLSSRIEKLLGDYCRRCRYGNLRLPEWGRVTPESLLHPVRVILSRPNLHLRNAPAREDTAAHLTVRWRELLAALRGFWHDDFAAPLYGRLNAGFGEAELRGRAEKLARLLAEEDPDGTELTELLKLFHPDLLLSKAGRRRADNCDAVREQLARPEFAVIRTVLDDFLPRCRRRVRQDAVDFVREKLTEWKKQDNFQSFDDLILRVYEALQQPGGRLRAALHKRCRAGIIDEFQDTDPLQYGIFRAIFAERPDPLLFMVGDPRQAIYTFRGGDLATYLAAARETVAAGGTIATLQTNYRSSGALIHGVNRIFAGHKLPFAVPEIGFAEVSAPEGAPPPLLHDGKPDPRPLGILRKDEWRTADCRRWCADTMLEMLQGNWRLPSGEKVEPEHMAVLCYDRFELQEMRRELNARNIPVISVRSGTVWHSEAAGHLAVLLDAVLEPGDMEKIQRALLTPLGGMSYGELAEKLAGGEDFPAETRAEFAALLAVWHQHGFPAFLRRFEQDFQLPVRVMTRLGGERTLTDFHQLGDLLGAEAAARKLSPRAVLKFLHDSIRRADDGMDEHLEQLETDRSAVKLLTVHASKGLQFPIVFLPGLFRRYPGRRTGGRGVYHEAGELCFDLDGGDPAAAMRSDREELQELLRLVYVAVTRAQYACRVVWGKAFYAGGGKKEVTTSPLDWLFRMRDYEGDAEAVLTALAAEKSPPVIPAELVPEAETGVPSGGRYAPPPPDLSGCACPALPAVRPDDWNMVSYSSLPWRGEEPPETVAEELLPDYDRNDEDGAEVSAETFSSAAAVPEIMLIPGGAAIGNAWHGILEESDLQTLPNAPLTGEILRRFGFADALTVRATAAMLTALAATRLECGIAVGEIAPERCRKEMEFLFDLPHGLSLPAWRRAVAPYWRKRFQTPLAAGTPYRLDGGLFHGFIDLVFEHENRFYIVDWKSNRLGGDPEAFAPERLAGAMLEHLYPMQYLIYLAAWIKYLALRLGRPCGEEDYERRFGGIYYIFLRGVSPGRPGYGIFSDRPDWETVRSLLQVLEDGA